MNAADEYKELIRIRDERHAAAMQENARLRAEVQALVGITTMQRDVDRLLATPC